MSIIKSLIDRIRSKKESENSKEPTKYTPYIFDDITDYESEYVTISSCPTSQTLSTNYKLYYYKDYIESDLDGGRDKQFYRCESGLFKPLFDELKYNADSSFVTPYNDLIKEGYIPQTLSVLRYDFEQYDYHDIYNSKILNFFKVPTVYITKCINEHGNESLLSVDFIGKNEKFKTLYDSLGISCESTTNLLGGLTKAFTDYKQKIDENSIERKDQFNAELAELKKDFVRQILFSRYVIGETDGCSNNFGILENTTEKYFKLAPLFDIQNCNPIEEYSKFKLEDLEFIFNNFPDVLKKVVEELTLATQIDNKTGQNKLYEAIHNSFDPDTSKLENFVIDNYTKNSQLLIDYYMSKNPILSDNEPVKE